MNLKMENVKIFNDDRGCLIPLEFSDLPFIPKRIFVVNNVPQNSVRGNHSHYLTKQMLFCINGVIEVILHDGKIENIYKLNKGDYMMIPELVWDSQKFISSDSEIMVLCSTNYDPNDYIFDFETFIKIKNNN
jgi:UDP-2-acetamido-3-amino-2,3-dideoxy-glucuronate N-acetyltransferase